MRSSRRYVCVMFKLFYKFGRCCQAKNEGLRRLGVSLGESRSLGWGKSEGLKMGVLGRFWEFFWSSENSLQTRKDEHQYPDRESNSELSFRRALLYPFNYQGAWFSGAKVRKKSEK